MPTERGPARLLGLVTHLVIGLMAFLVVVAAAQPIVTDDVWWHLALGDTYAHMGPWLARDPLLFTAPGPPLPSAWLADLGLFSIADLGGFNLLRATHVLLVGSILALAWSLLERASSSRLLASLGTGGFIVLSAYRLIQLRPHLLTILFTLLLYRLMLESTGCPSRRRVAASAALCALWANLHAGFVLGPALLFAAAAGIGVFAALQTRSWSQVASPHAAWVGLAAGLGALATCLNPAGIEPHLAYFAAGAETPSLARVADEWIAVAPFRLPAAGRQPAPMAWIVFWVLLLGSILAVIRSARRLRSKQSTDPPEVDPILLSLSGLGLVASLTAVRFLWLGIFPLLLLSSWLGQRCRSSAGLQFRSSVVLGWSAAVALLLLIGFTRFGDWPGISRSIPPTLQQLAQPFSADKYHAHAVWMLKDAALEGNLFNEYYMGGFLGYWLAPGVRTFVNGSLNVSHDAIDANLPIRQRRGALAEESFLELLDRQAIDLFLGIGVPRLKRGSRPWFHTTAHLEGAPGWITVFRNITSAVYLRNSPGNAENLERVSAYYRDRDVPFDSERGFDVARVLREARSWSIANGVAPYNYDQLLAASDGARSRQRLRSLAQLGSFYSALGLYRDAIEIDRTLLESNPLSSAARRRIAWCSVRTGQYAQALEVAEAPASGNPPGRLLQSISEVARIGLEGQRDVSGPIARLPVFTHPEAQALRAAMVRAPTREKRFEAPSDGPATARSRNLP